MTAEEHEEGAPVVRDRRRIDPETGQVRESRSVAAPSASGGSAQAAGEEGQQDLAAALAERTSDLQRLQAEYLNYKRRVDRDREATRQNAIGSVLFALLPVLDDIGRARDHGELTGGFKAVAESLERTVSGLGLEKFGQAGEPFDPRIHDALMHSYSDEVSEPVCSRVLEVGYRHADRILRPARVAVAEPPSPPVDLSSRREATSAVDADSGGRQQPEDATGDVDGTAAVGDERADATATSASAEPARES